MRKREFRGDSLFILDLVYNDLLSISTMLKYLWMAWLYRKVPMDNPFLITDMGALGAICYLNGTFHYT